MNRDGSNPQKPFDPCPHGIPSGAHKKPFDPSTHCRLGVPSGTYCEPCDGQTSNTVSTTRELITEFLADPPPTPEKETPSDPKDGGPIKKAWLKANRKTTAHPKIDGEDLSSAEINYIRQWRKGSIG